MRVISMQSPKVLEILRRDGIYKADLDLCRERADYSDDIRNLNGLVPIWCWAYPDLSFRTLFNGEILEYLRCEMSLQQDNCWEPFLMLEIEVDANLLHKGVHHNDCPYSKVFGELRVEMLRAVYKVTDSDRDGWYYKIIHPIWAKDENDCITSEVLDCHFWKDCSYLAPHKYFSDGNTSTCLHCGKLTNKTYLNKHLCSLKCMFKFQHRFMTMCTMRGMDSITAVDLYNSLTDKDLIDGAYEYAQAHIETIKYIN